MNKLAHSDAQLRLANVCHPSLKDGRLRHRCMLDVARATHNTAWIHRLQRTTPSAFDGHTLAMEMLDDYERGSSPPPPQTPGAASSSSVLVVLVLVVILILWVLRVLR